MRRWFVAALVVVVFVSCNRKPGTQETTSDSTREVKGKFAIESGIVEYKTNVMGFDAVQTLYFDGFGARTATETNMEIMGMKARTCTVTREGITYNFDPEKTSGFKMSEDAGPGNIDFKNLTEEVRRKMNMQEMGEETVLGRSCIKYAVEDNSLNMKGSYWVWQGIPLKMDVDMGTSRISMEAVSVKENPGIPEIRFEIPSDITFEGPGPGFPKPE